jgi:predicted MFS family arabinose efflux permease
MPVGAHREDVDELHRATRGTWLAFCLTGVVGATWASRIPAVQDRLDLSAGALAVVVLAVEGGALLGLPLGAALVARWGSRRVLGVALGAFVPGPVAAAVTPSLGVLVAVVLAWAAANSVLDVALNAQGTELGRRNDRPVLSGLHAGQSTGTVVGASVGTAAAATGVPFGWHATVVAAAGLAVALPAARATVPERSAAPGRERGRTPLRPGRPLVLLGAVAFCAFLVDGAATNWIAVHLRSEHGVGEGVAAAGYLGFAVALVLGRLPGDRLAARFSRRRLVQACAATMVAGATAVVLAPGPAGALIGWALVGLAVAPVAPAVLGAAPGVGSVPPASAIATVTTIGYLGSFTGPPLVGLLAEAGTLSSALLLLVAASVAAGLLARRAFGRR